MSLRRSWRVSLLAIATIAVSLFVGGLFLLLTDNLGRLIRGWRAEARVVVYLHSDAGEEELRSLRAALGGPSWVEALEEVDEAAARRRFEEIFPSLAELASGWEEEPLPASIEVSLLPASIEAAAYGEWLSELRSHPAVGMVDDDRDWLEQLELLVAVLRGVGLVLGGILLGAAVFTIASVIRLTAYLYREEIAVMRLVGATELYIRGPFYVEGLLQGLLGSLAALVALWGAYRALSPYGVTTLLGSGLLGRFLPLGYLLLLVAFGCAAGALGAIVSLRREAAA